MDRCVWFMTEEVQTGQKTKRKGVKQSRHPAPGRSSPPVGTNDENKSSCRAENLPVSPSIIQGKAFFSSAASRGAKAREGTAALTHSRVTARGKDTFVLGVSARCLEALRMWSEGEPSLISCHLVIETSNYGTVELMSCQARPCRAVRGWHPEMNRSGRNGKQLNFWGHCDILTAGCR